MRKTNDMLFGVCSDELIDALRESGELNFGAHGSPETNEILRVCATALDAAAETLFNARIALYEDRQDTYDLEAISSAVGMVLDVVDLLLRRPMHDWQKVKLRSLA